MIGPLRWLRNLKEEGLTLDMKIAQVAPLYESVPPKCYEGTEYVVFVMLQCVLQRAREQRFIATRMAREHVQHFERVITRNQHVSEAG